MNAVLVTEQWTLVNEQWSIRDIVHILSKVFISFIVNDCKQVYVLYTVKNIIFCFFIKYHSRSKVSIYFIFQDIFKQYGCML